LLFFFFLHPLPPIIMAALDPFLQGSSSQNTRGLLRVIILLTIAAAAVSSRLFSVIRKRFSNVSRAQNTDSAWQDSKASYTNVSLGNSSSTPLCHPAKLTCITVDPWFNFRATKYLVKHGFYSFWDWFDDSTQSTC
jgi:dolichyl-diphosphooligosaccharide---protein glycosyltransferase